MKKTTLLIAALIVSSTALLAHGNGINNNNKQGSYGHMMDNSSYMTRDNGNGQMGGNHMMGNRNRMMSGQYHQQDGHMGNGRTLMVPPNSTPQQRDKSDK